ncbi:hypothetical protein R3P38DRAFT_3566036 [Favolaschia claudopus]|uniref:Uncharacterized protein n=1 Tax=Favolaschia claudopus TaxID=2862362 RepID=A0AAW0DVF2_9AGAR
MSYQSLLGTDQSVQGMLQPSLPPFYQSFLNGSLPVNYQYPSSAWALPSLPVDKSADTSSIDSTASFNLSQITMGTGSGQPDDSVSPSSIVNTSLESPGSTPTPRARIRASNGNPAFGKVQGAYRGSETADIIRSRAQRQKISDRKECSARFGRKTKELIERCEDLAQETGCWLFFTAQHPYAKEPFYHFASSRLLRDSKTDVETIINQFNKIFASLLAGRQRDAASMHKKLQEALAAQASSSKALENVAEEKEALAVELAEKNALLEQKSRPFKWLARLQPDGAFKPALDKILIHRLGDNFETLEIYRPLKCEWVKLPSNSALYPEGMEETLIYRDSSLADEDCLHLSILIQRMHYRIAAGRYTATNIPTRYLMDPLDVDLVDGPLFDIFENL